MSRFRILLLEDDANLGLVLQEHLQMQGFEVLLCADGEQGLAAYERDKFDLCLLDIMMPRMDGFTFAREVRSRDREMPLIFLTAKSMKDDKIQGFKIGCDDYITKPFSIEELLLRIEAVMRRSRNHSDAQPPTDFRIGNYLFDSNRRILTMEDRQQKLTPKESELLLLLCVNMNQTVRREEALRRIWGDDNYFAGRSMDVFVSRLRKCLKDDPKVEIMSVHGIGFRLVAE